MTCDNVIPTINRRNKSNKRNKGKKEKTETMTCHCTLAVRQQCHYRKTSRQKVSSKVKQKRAQDGCLGTKSRRKTR